MRKQFPYPPLLNPPPYPGGFDFGILLSWHLNSWGTHADGNERNNSGPWYLAEFAALVIGDQSLSDGAAVKNVRNWTKAGEAPPKDKPRAIRVLEVLFGTEACFDQWRNDLTAAWEAHYNKTLFDGAKDAVGKTTVAPTAKQKRVGQKTQKQNVLEAHDDEPIQTLDNNDRSVNSVNGWPTLSPNAAQLADCMSDISEKCYCARWLDGLEYVLWSGVANGPRPFGNGYVTGEQIELLQILSDSCGGWISWDEEAPRNVNPQKWVPLDYWKAHWANPHEHPLENKVFIDPRTEGQRRLLYGFVDDTDRSSWKREALFFDKIVLPDLTWDLDPDGWHWSGPTRWDDGHIAARARPFLDLVRHGVFLPSATHHFPQSEIEKRVNKEAEKYHWEAPERRALEARLQSLKFARIHGAEAYPLYSNLHNFSAGVSLRREAVLRIVFARIPVPLDSVSWNEIIDYRLDSESRRRFTALRVWINRATSGCAAMSEVVEELEHLIAEFESHMKRHRMSYQMMPFEVVVAERPEVIREMAGLHKATADGQGVFMYRDSSILFPEDEFSAPGKELAYISASKIRFLG